MTMQNISEEKFQAIKSMFNKDTHEPMEIEGEKIYTWGVCTKLSDDILDLESDEHLESLEGKSKEYILGAYYSKRNDIQEEIEDIDSKYEIQVFNKASGRYTDSVFCYADNREHALKIVSKEFLAQYPKSEYDYEVEYHGTLESDRGYEMELDREVYS